MTLYRRCPEAYLAHAGPTCSWWRCDCHGEGGMVPVVWPCEKCDGSGRRLCRHDHHVPGDTTNGCVMYQPCPDCGGSGWEADERYAEITPHGGYDAGLWLPPLDGKAEQ